MVSSLLKSLLPKEINKHARKTGFVKINSLLYEITFLKLLFQNSEKDKNMSPILMCLRVLNDKRKRISKQALDARFRKKSTLFIKTISLK